MAQPVRHQCLIYNGSPAQSLPALAGIVRRKLAERHRCLYLNNPKMLDGLRQALNAAGVAVADAETKGDLVLSSDMGHLLQGRFDIDRMMSLLSDGLARALGDGYQGLFAVGDMTWQLGPGNNEDSLLEYEWRLEQFFRRNPGLSGICQYHVDTLPEHTVREGLVSHPALFVNETLLRVNAHYVPPEVFTAATLEDAALDEAIAALITPDEGKK